MDELDRLHIELVDIIRKERPDDLETPVSIAELHRELVPYQRVRSSAGFRSYDDYETALSRLLSGERDYLSSDAADMQAEVTAGLGETYPDVRRFHAFDDARVWLSSEHIPPPGHVRYAPPDVQEEAIRLAEQERMEREEARRREEEEERKRAAEEELEAQRLEKERRDAERREVARSAGLRACEECDAELPDGPLRFCPFCGARLRLVCSACGALMLVGWKFCGECGVACEEEPA